MKEKQKEKQLSTNRFILPILFIVCSIILEIANFLYLGLKNSDGGSMFLPSYFLFDFAIILMLAAFIYILQNRVLILIAFALLLALQAGVGIVNATLYSLFGEVLSVNLLKLGAEATTAFSFSLVDWGGVFLNACLFLAMLIGGILLTIFNKKSFSLKYFATPIIAIALFIFIEAFGTCLYEVQIYSLKTEASQESEIESSDVYLWENFHFKMDAYKKFGFYGFYTKEIYNSITSNYIENEEKIDYIKYIDDGHIKGNKEAPLYNDNLITILMESVDLFAIDPVYTPTLYKIFNGWNSVALKNFHAKNRTNNSEGIALLGSMPKNSLIKDAFMNGYQFDYSLPHLFKRSGDENVVTTYIHPNRKTFYDRNITFGSTGIGFDYMLTQEEYTGDQIKYKWGDWIQDCDFVKSLIDYILPQDKRFYTHFSSMSTHGPYTFERKNFTEEYKVYDENLDAYKVWLEEAGFVYPKDQYTQDLLRNFMVGTIDFENTINYLLDELDKRGLAENTSILFYTDHNAYYEDLCFLMRGIKKSDVSHPEANHIPAMIYSPKLVGEKGMVIDDFCNTYDLLPTICDIYGLESNDNLFSGYSVFSKDIKDSFFSSHLSGMFKDDIYSINISDIYIRGESITEEEINRFRENAIEFYDKQAIREVIYFNGINGTIFRK